MSGRDRIAHEVAAAAVFAGVTLGRLVGLSGQGRTALVLFPGQPGAAALAARSVVDLHAAHLGRQVALMFEAADPSRPVVMGVLCDGEGWPLAAQPAQVDADADGMRLVVSARTQLVLRCGSASITLTAAGKVLIAGDYVETRSAGMNRVKGGSVQIN